MRVKMRVAPIVGVRKAELREVRTPVPGPEEVLVKIRACALCTWEQRMFTGTVKMPLPFVGGHEIAGEVVELGPNVNPRIQVGDKVALRMLERCGECYYCRQGEDNLCVAVGKRHSKSEIPGVGGLGEYVAVHSSRLFKLAPDIPFTHGAFAEPLACVIHSVERGAVELGNDVVVVGAGIMGLLHVMLAKRKGARVIVSEVSMERRQLACQLGADETVNPAEADAVQQIRELTEGRGADVVFHTTAISKVAEQAVKMAGKMGRVVMYGSFHPDEPISLSPNAIHYNEVVITGSVSPSTEDFQKSAKLLSNKIIDPASLIYAEVPFEDVQRAFELAVDPHSLRVIVTMK